MNFTFIMNLFFHLDTYLNTLLSQYNMLAYVVVFIIIFLETGLVVTPFLPGDLLIFALGAIAAAGGPISIPLILFLLYVAAFGVIARKRRVRDVWVQQIDFMADKRSWNIEKTSDQEVDCKIDCHE